jgi:hypothetical protein
MLRGKWPTLRVLIDASDFRLFGFNWCMLSLAVKTPKQTGHRSSLFSYFEVLQIYEPPPRPILTCRSWDLRLCCLTPIYMATHSVCTKSSSLPNTTWLFQPVDLTLTDTLQSNDIRKTIYGSVRGSNESNKPSIEQCCFNFRQTLPLLSSGLIR